MTYEQMAKRAKQLANQVFAEGKVNIKATETDKYFDGYVTFNGHVGIMEVDLEEKSNKGYQVFGIVYDPGVMYHRDGSGTPPSEDCVDIGEPYSQFDTAVVEALKYVLEKSLEDFLVNEYEEKYWGEMADREDDRYDIEEEYDDELR